MEEVELNVVLPWDGEPKRPVIPIGDEKLVFKAQLAADEYAEALLAINDPVKRYDVLRLSVADESSKSLEGLLEDSEGGIGAVAAARMTTALARFYGMLAREPGGLESVDPTSPGSQPRSPRKPRSGASGSGKKQV